MTPKPMTRQERDQLVRNVVIDLRMDAQSGRWPASVCHAKADAVESVQAENQALPDLLAAAERIAQIDPAVMTSDEFVWCGYCNEPEDSTLLDVEDGWSELPHAPDCPGVTLRAAVAKART